MQPLIAYESLPALSLTALEDTDFGRYVYTSFSLLGAFSSLLRRPIDELAAVQRYFFAATTSGSVILEIFFAAEV